MAFYGDTEPVQAAMSGALLLILIAAQVRLNACIWSGRTLQTDLSLGNGRNWEGGRAPCEADRVVFRSQAALTLALPEGATALRALVLPSSVELLLPVTGGSLRFTGETRTPTCDGRDVIFAHVRPLRWLDADNWDGWNVATPSLERVPCATDAVRLPSSSLQMTLPPILRLGQLEINGKMMDPVEWSQYVSEGEGSRHFATTEEEGDPPELELTLETCHEEQWCGCRNDYLRPLICQYRCPVPHCEQPVQPDGFCCPFCGAYFLLSVPEEDNPLLNSHLDRTLADGTVAWHASRRGGLLQVVLTNAGEYAGDIARIAADLKASFERSPLDWSTVELHASGHIWHPSSFSALLIHFLSLFVCAALTLAAVVVFYSQDWSWAGLSPPVGGRPFMFARFMGDGEGGEGEGAMVVVASQPPDSAPVPAQSFDNPLYGNPTTHQGMKTTTGEEMSEPSDFPLAGQTFDNPMYVVAQQEGSTLDSPVYCELAETAPKYSLEDTETLLGTSNGI